MRKTAVHTTAIVEMTFGASLVGLPVSGIQLQVEIMKNTPHPMVSSQLIITIILVPTCIVLQSIPTSRVESAYWAGIG